MLNEEILAPFSNFTELQGGTRARAYYLSDIDASLSLTVNSIFSAIHYNFFSPLSDKSPAFGSGIVKLAEC